MDRLEERLEALESAVREKDERLKALRRRQWQLRAWQGVAAALALAAVLGLTGGPPAAQAQGGPRTSADQLARLAVRLKALREMVGRHQLIAGRFTPGRPRSRGNDAQAAANELAATQRGDLTLTGNLYLVNGLGATNGNPANPSSTTGTVNGSGNLIIGYNEAGNGNGDYWTGSHNLIVGRSQSFTSFAGLIAGMSNSITAPFASVTGGAFNTASGIYASVSGGGNQTANGSHASVSGGQANAAGAFATVSGGANHIASGRYASIGGGQDNRASGESSSVSVGEGSSATATYSAVAGGRHHTISGMYATAGGGGGLAESRTYGWRAGQMTNNESEGGYFRLTP